MIIKKTVRASIVVYVAFVASAAVFHITARADTTGGASAASATSSVSMNLQDQLKQKEQEISAVNDQISATKESLKTVQSQRVTLQQQLNLLNGNIKTLNLGIQADTLTLQQLDLQIQQLNGDLQNINDSISLKQSAISTILQNMEKNDRMNGNLLALFLRKGTLADSVLEANSLVNLQGQLAVDISGLQDLHAEYDQTLQKSSAKATNVTSEQQDLQSKKSILQDQSDQKKVLLTDTKNQESVFQQQYSDLQKQQAKINDEIEAIAAVLRTKIDPSTLPAFGPGVLLVPISGDGQADVTQGYGATTFAKHEYVHHWHNGIDLAASIGMPVLAAYDGVVDATANEDLYCPHGAYGKFITINHPNGLTTLYAHLSRWIVSNGQAVKRGQIIGYSGNTGDVTGPHLHFTVFAQSTYTVVHSQSCGQLPEGGDLDPISYLW